MKKVSSKQQEKIEERKKKTLEMKLVFMEIWKKRKHNSEVSGKWLGREPLTVFFHHILPKSKYPEAQMDEENIILLTFDEHTFVETFPDKYPEINERREKLKLKYG
jgi:hypothetical protein